MKIVINRCYGGFSLSPLAVQRMAELQGRPCYFYDTDFKNGKTTYVPKTIEQLRGERWLFFTAYDVPAEVLNLHQQNDWHTLSAEEREASNKWHDEHSIDTRPDDRTDPILIQVVEELGHDADGSCAELTIVEIPNGVDYEITDYDGMERVAEKHRTWG